MCKMVRRERVFGAILSPLACLAPALALGSSDLAEIPHTSAVGYDEILRVIARKLERLVQLAALTRTKYGIVAARERLHMPADGCECTHAHVIARSSRFLDLIQPTPRVSCRVLRLAKEVIARQGRSLKNVSLLEYSIVHLHLYWSLYLLYLAWYRVVGSQAAPSKLANATISFLQWIEMS